MICGRWLVRAAIILICAAAPAFAEQRGDRDRAIVVAEADIGPELKRLTNLANQLTEAGRLAEAEAAIRQAENLAAQSPRYAKRGRPVFLTTLGNIYLRASRFSDAEAMFTQAIQAQEAISGPNDPMTIEPRVSLATMMIHQGRLQEAGPLIIEAERIARQADGVNDPGTAEVWNVLAVYYLHVGQYPNAEKVFLQALGVFQKNPSRFALQIADVLVNLSTIYRDTKQYPKAMQALEQARATYLKLNGPTHPNTLTANNNLALVYDLAGEYDKAYPLFKQALDGQTALYGPDHAETAKAQNNLGWMFVYKKDYASARPLLLAALKAYLKVRERQVQGLRSDGMGVSEREIGRTVLGLLKANAGLAAANERARAELTDEAFEAAQAVGRTAAAQSLTRAVARFAAGTDERAKLTREAQQLAQGAEKINQELTKVLSLPAAQRNTAAEQQARQQLAAIDARLAELSGIIGRDFPEYASLVRPKPLAIKELQKLLRPDEAVIYISTFGGTNGEGTFTWTITAKGTDWSNSEQSAEDLARAVAVLRCGLDPSQWTGDGGAACAKLTGISDPAGILPFNAKFAYQLYDLLLGGNEAAIAGKTLYIVAPEPLASLPFQILLTKDPGAQFPVTTADFRALSWLGRSNPIAVLPSVESLKGLRTAVKTASAPEAYIGFGNPALTGSRRCPRALPVAETCPGETGSKPMTVAAQGMRMPMLPPFEGLYKSNGMADVEAVRGLCPLPDTALELRCVARALGAPAGQVKAAEAASLTTLRHEMLSKYRIIHFATHGLIASQTRGLGSQVGEPALVLTPPATATADDDGLLKVSEIVTLKLNADWVVLSACNTAGSTETSSEPLSGLASAFFYAGARALLVSHWPVVSSAAVTLMSRAFDEMKKTPALGRAKAMQHAMTALRDSGDEGDAHPSVWAPFSVVGEAGAVGQP